MLRLLGELVMGPVLVGGSTLVARRWGTQIGGVISALPAVVGPVLLITAMERGPASADQAAKGTLLGLVALGGFVVTYARVARFAQWGVCLLSGWACAAVISIVVGWLADGAGPGVGLAAAAVSLFLAYRTMPRSGTDLETDGVALTGIFVRMAVTGALVGSLAIVAVLVGPLVGGMLAALPVLASVLAVFTHRRGGGDAVVALFRGMLLGMGGFVGFCAVVAWLIVPAGTTWTFALAAMTAIGLQLLVLALRLGMTPGAAAQPAAG